MFSLLPLLTTALASTVKLTTDSTDPSLNGKGLSNFHFGAGINGILLSDFQYIWNYELPSNRVYSKVVVSNGVEHYYLGDLFSEVVASAGDVPFATVNGSYLEIYGSDSFFYACDHVEWDPYHYVNATNLGLGIYREGDAVPTGCQPIRIRAEVY